MTDQLRRSKCCPDAAHLASGLCSTHYQRLKNWRRGVKPKTPDEREWLEAIAMQEKQDKKARANERFEARRKKANANKRVENGYRKYTTKYRYGVTQEYVDLLREQQRGKCALCESSGTLYIDHSHETGVVRGLLCPGCNTMIGVIERRGHLFEAAFKYVNERNVGTDDRPKKD